MRTILTLLLLIIFINSKAQTTFKDTSFTYHMPNAFTPNGDGLNDTFGPLVINDSQHFLTIVDRYNNVIFSSNGEHWDGTVNNKVVMIGVYVWQLKIVSKSGKSYLFYGHFTLL